MAKIKQLKDKSGTEQIFPKTKTQAIFNEDGSLLSETLDNLYGSLATIESSPTTTSHSAGEYILYEGRVYKVTAAIASGDSLVGGTNISAVNLGSQIDTLNSKTTPQIKTISYTAGANVSVRSVTCIRIGKLVELNIYFDTTAQIANNAHIIDVTAGLPTPMGTYATGIARAVNGSLSFVSLERLHNTYIASWGATPAATYYYVKLLYITSDE